MNGQKSLLKTIKFGNQSSSKKSKKITPAYDSEISPFINPLGLALMTTWNWIFIKDEESGSYSSNPIKTDPIHDHGDYNLQVVVLIFEV